MCVTLVFILIWKYDLWNLWGEQRMSSHNMIYLLVSWNQALGLKLKFLFQSDFFPLSLQSLGSFSVTPLPPPPPLVIYCGSDNVNGLCPTWSSECIVPLLADPRSVWCVKSIYLNLFACIGIWQRASCFHLMFFVLNTDKQACFCTPLSSGLFSFQPIFYSVDFSERSRNVLPF